MDRFTNQQAEEAFRSHPLHLKLKNELIQPLACTDQAPSVVAVDFHHEGAGERQLDQALFFGASVGFALGAALCFVGLSLANRR